MPPAPATGAEIFPVAEPMATQHFTSLDLSSSPSSPPLLLLGTVPVLVDARVPGRIACILAFSARSLPGRLVWACCSTRAPSPSEGRRARRGERRGKKRRKASPQERSGEERKGGKYCPKVIPEKGIAFGLSNIGQVRRRSETCPKAIRQEHKNLNEHFRITFGHVLDCLRTCPILDKSLPGQRNAVSPPATPKRHARAGTRTQEHASASDSSWLFTSFAMFPVPAFPQWKMP